MNNQYNTSVNGTSFMKVLKTWCIAIRPKTLTAGVSPIFTTYGFISIYKDQTSSLSILLLITICTLLMQIGTNLVNDYFDGIKGIDSSNRLGPKRVVASGLIPARQVQQGYRLCFLLAFLIGIYLMIVGGSYILALGILSLIFAYAYTGGPLPLSHFALGELLAFIFFGPVAMLGTAIIFSSTELQDIFYLSIPFGFWSSALMSVNNLRDLDTDKKVQKITIATLLGENWSRFFTLALLLMPFICLIGLCLFNILPKVSLIALLALGVLLNKNINIILVSERSCHFNDVLANTGKALTLFSLLLIMSFIIQSFL